MACPLHRGPCTGMWCWRIMGMWPPWVRPLSSWDLYYAIWVFLVYFPIKGAGGVSSSPLLSRNSKTVPNPLLLKPVYKGETWALLGPVWDSGGTAVHLRSTHGSSVMDSEYCRPRVKLVLVGRIYVFLGPIWARSASPTASKSPSPFTCTTSPYHFP